MHAYGVYLDKGMLQNVFETNVAETRELVSNDSLLWHVFVFGALPSAALILLPVKRFGYRHAVIRRSVCIVLSILIATGALWNAAGDLVPLFREQKELRYLVTPANYLTSAARVLTEAQPSGNSPKLVAAPDAIRITPSVPYKPKAFVVIVGETIRAANWGLNGYRRQTTPSLSQRQVINFEDVESCGTSTAVSLPCMFSFRGRRNYDERQIRATESVLHVLNRVGVTTLWRDNQAGCKGVCEGLPFESLNEALPDCRKTQCFDEHLLDGLAKKIQSNNGDILIVLHMMGNHGPAYSLRYPPTFMRWAPVCTDVNLGLCTTSALVNAYDNGVAYADYVVSKAIDLLGQISSHETGLLFISDHGESLGESNVYLHGLPYVLAPDVQKRVPLVMWLSEPLSHTLAVDISCLRRTTKTPRSHDDLPSTLLGLFDVKATAYEPKFDLLAACRRQ